MSGAYPLSRFENNIILQTPRKRPLFRVPKREQNPSNGLSKDSPFAGTCARHFGEGQKCGGRAEATEFSTGSPRLCSAAGTTATAAGVAGGRGRSPLRQDSVPLPSLVAPRALTGWLAPMVGRGLRRHHGNRPTLRPVAPLQAPYGELGGALRCRQRSAKGEAVGPKGEAKGEKGREEPQGGKVAPRQRWSKLPLYGREAFVGTCGNGRCPRA